MITLMPTPSLLFQLHLIKIVCRYSQTNHTFMGVGHGAK